MEDEHHCQNDVNHKNQQSNVNRLRDYGPRLVLYIYRLISKCRKGVVWYSRDTFYEVQLCNEDEHQPSSQAPYVGVPFITVA